MINTALVWHCYE